MKQHDPLSILIVEAGPAVLRALTEQLSVNEVCTMVVDSVASVAGALDRLAHNKIGVVILDLNLPNGQGVVVVQRIQAAAPHIPLVVATETIDPGLRRECLRAGAQEVLEKVGLTASELAAHIVDAVVRHEVRSVFLPMRKNVAIALAAAEEALKLPEGP